MVWARDENRAGLCRKDCIGNRRAREEEGQRGATYDQAASCKCYRTSSPHKIGTKAKRKLNTFTHTVGET